MQSYPKYWKLASKLNLNDYLSVILTFYRLTIDIHGFVFYFCALAELLAETKSNPASLMFRVISSEIDSS